MTGWGVTPRQSIRAACDRLGCDVVAEVSIGMLRGEAPDPEMVRMLAGPQASRVIADERNEQWLRIWAVRGLLWNWDERAYDVLLVALHDEEWRVREMACKVVARHLLGDAAHEVAALQDDEVRRVRSAANRAVMRLTDARA